MQVSIKISPPFRSASFIDRASFKSRRDRRRKQANGIVSRKGIRTIKHEPIKRDSTPRAKDSRFLFLKSARQLAGCFLPLSRPHCQLWYIHVHTSLLQFQRCSFSGFFKFRQRFIKINISFHLFRYSFFVPLWRRREKERKMKEKKRRKQMMPRLLTAC